MKVAQTKTGATQSKNNSPFFSKESESGFFSTSNVEPAFFSGSSAANSTIQAKLTVGKPNDHYEKEADRMAEKVVQRSTDVGSVKNNNDESIHGVKPVAPINSITPLIQKKCAECEKEEKLQKKDDEKDLNQDTLQAKPIFESEAEPKEKSVIQRKCAECEKEEKLQKKENSNVESGSYVQAKCAACEKEEGIQRKPIFESEADKKLEGNLQRKCAECEKEEKTEKVQKKGISQNNGPVHSPSSSLESSLSNTKGNGTPMSPITKSTMESSFGADFSNVRIHQSSAAAQMNKDLHARAFTHGNDIYFRSGEYNPGSKSGQQLLAHELTHTIQQGQNKALVNGSKVETSSDISSIQRATDCNAPKEKGGSQNEAKANETTQITAPCAVTNQPGEKPPEGQEEPGKEETPKDISAGAGAPPDDRQSHAPAPDENAPSKEKGISKDQKKEQPLDPCALREKNAKERNSPTPTSTPNNRGDIPSGGPQMSLPATATASGGQKKPAIAGKTKSAQEGKTSTKKKKSEGDPELNFLHSIAAQGISPNITPAGLGEAASPELREQRDGLMEEEKGALNTLDATRNAVALLANVDIQFIPPQLTKGDSQENKKQEQELKSNHSQSGLIANACINSATDQLIDFIDQGKQSAESISKKREDAKKLLQAEIKNRRKETSGKFAGMRGGANSRAAFARKQVESNYAQTVAQIELTAISGILQLQLANAQARPKLDQAYANHLQMLELVYNAAYYNLLNVGYEVGLEAVRRAAIHEGAFRRAEKAPADVQDKVINKKKDGFWDGYLTYNRYMARADSAKEVGKQYNEGMVKEAQSQADNMMCGKAADLNVSNKIAEQGTKILQCTLDNSLDAIQRQRQAALMQAQHARQQLLAAIQASLLATITQLREKEAVQLQLINDYGIRQAMAIERDASQAISSFVKGVNDASTTIQNAIAQFRDDILTSQAPNPKEFELTAQSLQGQLRKSIDAAVGATQNSQSGSETHVSASSEKAFHAIQQLCEDGIKDGNMLAISFAGTMNRMSTNAKKTYSTLWTNAGKAIREETKSGIQQINGVVTAITGLYTQMQAGLTKRFQESASHMRKGMIDSLNKDFDHKICTEAEKAAQDVQPWWKTVLKVLLVIVVIVVVALVIGPAVIGAVGAMAASAAGALGASVALAGTIGTWVGAIVGGAIVGALSGAVIQVGNNLIDAIGNGPLTWDKVTKGVWQAVVAGAIGGALGGLGGQLGQLLVGKLATVVVSNAGRFLIQSGVEVAFDVLGGVLGDLANGNPISLENVVKGVIIGRVVQVSMAGAGRIARMGHQTVEAGGTASRTQRIAMAIEKIQVRSMAKGEAFGGAVGNKAFGGPSAEWSSKALATAREAMAPRRPGEENKSSGERQEAAVHERESELTSKQMPTAEEKAGKITETPSKENAPESRTGEQPKTGAEQEPGTGTQPEIKEPGIEPSPTKSSDETTPEVKTENLEEGVRAEKELPAGHKEQVNDEFEVEGCTTCEPLKRRYKKLFEDGHVNMDEASFNKLVGEFDQVKESYLSKYGEEITLAPTEADQGKIYADGKTRQEIYESYLKDVNDIEARLLQNIDPVDILVVGDATFEYSRALKEKLSSQGKVGEAYDITASGIESRTEAEAMVKAREVEPLPPAGQKSSEGGAKLELQHEVDAQNLQKNFPPDSFDKIVFNNPEINASEAKIGEMLDNVLKSAPSVLKEGGEVQIGITSSTKAKGRLKLEEHLSSGTIDINGRSFKVTKIDVSKDFYEFQASYNARRTEGGRLRTSTGPSFYYIFKLLPVNPI